MIQVRYLTSEASATWTREPGGIYDLQDAEAEAAIACGKAERVAEPDTPEADAPEAATRSGRETAMKPRAQGR